MRKALREMAWTTGSHYRLRKALSAGIEIVVTWAVLMLLYWIGFEVIAALTF
ncbi:hypothetical protein LCGC14_1133410 [marine sediment metagenome]|uniref:Uncharacterized protein n=1 Tax=marine sediment metagenome TaxID=412755 RepID=A0A0F9Q686_9ZZZZ